MKSLEIIEGKEYFIKKGRKGKGPALTYGRIPKSEDYIYDFITVSDDSRPGTPIVFEKCFDKGPDCYYIRMTSCTHEGQNYFSFDYGVGSIYLDGKRSAKPFYVKFRDPLGLVDFWDISYGGPNKIVSLKEIGGKEWLHPHYSETFKYSRESLAKTIRKFNKDSPVLKELELNRGPISRRDELSSEQKFIRRMTGTENRSVYSNISLVEV